MKTTTNSMGTSTTFYENDVYNRIEVTFIPKNFYSEYTERMLWKAFETEMNRQLMNAYDTMFGDTKPNLHKIHDTAQHRIFAIDELKKYYYKHNKTATLSSKLYTITIIINGYIK